jgi:hypothetical protein
MRELLIICHYNIEKKSQLGDIYNTVLAHASTRTHSEEGRHLQKMSLDIMRGTSIMITIALNQLMVAQDLAQKSISIKSLNKIWIFNM